MPKFIDKEKREWVVNIDIPIAREIRRRLDVNILDMSDGLSAVSEDPILFCDVLYLLCESQADRLSMNDVEFGKMLQGETLGLAGEAYQEALILFSPPRKGAILKGLKDSAEDMEKALQEVATDKMPSMVQRAKQAIFGWLSQSGQESSDTSLPEHSGT